MKTWDKYDILRLAFLTKIKKEEQDHIINNFDSFADYIYNHSQGIGYLQSNELFSHDKALIEKKKDEQLEICEKEKIGIITRFDPDYPALLKEIKEPPLLLFVQGNMQAADSMAIAMVGTRRATRYGKLNAERFAEHFAMNNIIVVSGLAYGIDTYSHKATIKAGGITYAVIASGIDKLGPAESRANADKIIESGGALISNYFCGISAIPPFFLHRNRIIAGISKATLVVECGFKSGAMNTARHAFDESREVFAIPGNITSEKSVGTNILIKQNKAALALSPKSILEDLGILSVDKSEELNISFSDENEKNIFLSLNLEPMHIDEISEKTELDISIILVKLLELEFKGAVKQLPGKFYIQNR